ncbi:MAG: hypothetical protein AABY22_20540 [Nanoarchaeota archaeon]
MGLKIAVKSSILNAITYDICFNLPNEEIKKLPFKYRKILASSTRTKFFCENSTLDEKTLFFYHLGLDFGFTLLLDKAKAGIALKEIWDSLHEKKMALVQKQASELGVYVTTSKDTAFYMGLIGQTINNQTFLRTLEFNKTGYNLRNWSKELNHQSANDSLEVEGNAKYVNQTLLNTGITFDVCNTLFGISDVHMKVLMFFYDKRQSYISPVTVNSKFQGYVQTRKINSSLKKLLLNGFLNKHIDYRNLQYTITASGIKTVNEFIAQVLKQNEF